MTAKTFVHQSRVVLEMIKFERLGSKLFIFRHLPLSPTQACVSAMSARCAISTAGGWNVAARIA